MGISSKDVEAELTRILSSERFSASPRGSALLSYVVNATISGNADKLKGYSIAVDVFERPDDFDPQTDSIVRVQAGRLREMLRAYYLTTGQNNPVRIELPKGRYVPVFTISNDQYGKMAQANEDSVSEPTEEVQADPSLELRDQTNKTSRFLWGGLVGTIFIALVTLFFLRAPHDNTQMRNAMLEPPAGPSVTVLPFSVPTFSQDQQDYKDATNLSTGLQFALVSELSHFKDIMVISAGKANLEGLPISEEIEEIKSDYVLSGIVQVENNRIQVTSTLSSNPERLVIWSRSYNEPLVTTGGVLKIQAKISEDVATTLGQPYSPLNRSYVGFLSSDENANISEYYCLSRFYRYVEKKGSGGA